MRIWIRESHYYTTTQLAYLYSPHDSMSCKHQTIREVKVKGKGHPVTVHEGPKGEYRIALLFFNFGARGGGWTTSRPVRFTPWEDPVPTVSESEWVPGPVWTGAKNLTPTGIRSRTVQLVTSCYTD